MVPLLNINYIFDYFFPSFDFSLLALFICQKRETFLLFEPSCHIFCTLIICPHPHLPLFSSSSLRLYPSEQSYKVKDSTNLHPLGFPFSLFLLQLLSSPSSSTHLFLRPLLRTVLVFVPVSLLFFPHPFPQPWSPAAFFLLISHFQELMIIRLETFVVI